MTQGCSIFYTWGQANMIRAEASALRRHVPKLMEGEKVMNRNSPRLMPSFKGQEDEKDSTKETKIERSWRQEKTKDRQF